MFLDSGEEKYFLEFMICHHIQNLEKMLSEYKESIGNDTLKSGNDTLNISEKEKAVYEAIKKDTTVSIAQIVSLTDNI